MGIMLDLTDMCHDLEITRHHDEHYGGGEEIHQRQFIGEDELLSWDDAHSSHSALITPSRPHLLPLQTTEPTVYERWKRK